MAAFGCNYVGDVPVKTVIEQARILLDLCAEGGFYPDTLSLADTMGWATPLTIRQVVGAVRDHWPDLRINLHLDTSNYRRFVLWQGCDEVWHAPMCVICSGFGEFG